MYGVVYNEKGEKIEIVIGDKKVIFEPTPELVQTIRMFAPRKVFTY